MVLAGRANLIVGQQTTHTNTKIRMTMRMAGIAQCEYLGRDDAYLANQLELRWVYLQLSNVRLYFGAGCRTWEE